MECNKCKKDFVKQMFDFTCQSCKLEEEEKKESTRLVWDGRRFYYVKD